MENYIEQWLVLIKRRRHNSLASFLVLMSSADSETRRSKEIEPSVEICTGTNSTTLTLAEKLKARPTRWIGWSRTIVL